MKRLLLLVLLLLTPLLALSETAVPAVQEQPPVAPPPLAAGEREVIVTFGGDAVLGTRESWQRRQDAFPAYIEAHGMVYPFRRLLPVFAQDDMTVLNLECVLKADGRNENTDKQYRFRGLPSYAKILRLSFIEQASIANNHYIDYGTLGREATRQALTDAGVAYSGYGFTHVFEKDGLRIGFGGCRETVWLKDPTVIETDVRALREAGCDVILYTCHWGAEYQTAHNDVQEQMAQAAHAAGVDVVIGGHPHVVQGVGAVADMPVVYSLGNLVFGGTIDLTTYDGMLCQLRLRHDESGYLGCTVELIPVMTSSQHLDGINDYSPVIATGEDRARILALVQADTAFPLMEQMYFPKDR